MLERRAFRMAVRVSRGHVEIVEDFRLIDQPGGVQRQLGEQPRDHVTPRFLSARQMQGLHRHLGRLQSILFEESARQDCPTRCC
jgi:hypothetical protein